MYTSRPSTGKPRCDLAGHCHGFILLLDMSDAPKPPRHGVARVISKLGLGSRTQAAQWVREGRIRVNGRRVLDPELPVRRGLDRIEIDGREPLAATRLVLILNKPRGLVTTAKD